MSQYARWKIWLVGIVMVLGSLYALPNLFGEDPSVQVSGLRTAPVDDSTVTDIQRALELAGLTAKSVEVQEQRALVRMDSAEDQQKAREAIKDRLGDNYVVALNLAPATPNWLRAIGAKPMTLGLDLRGGVHFLMAMDRETALKQAETRLEEDIRAGLRDRRVRNVSVNTDGGRVILSAATEELREEARPAMDAMLTEVSVREQTSSDGRFQLVVELRPEILTQRMQESLESNLTTLRNRVNELGVAEPIVQQQGDDRIVVQLPGVQDTAQAKRILGATATLEYRAVDTTADLGAAMEGRVPPDSRLYYGRDGQPHILKKRVIASGNQLIGATSGFDPQGGTPQVSVTLNSAGGQRMLEFTRDNVGRPMGVVFVEDREVTRTVDGESVVTKERVEEVINVATIRGVFSTRFQTTGLDSIDEANNLALLLRAGSLAAPMSIVEERTVGASMGKENITRGFKAVAAGFALTVVFVMFYYKLFGLLAGVSLIFNVVMLIALLSMFGATLTMPGIAGILLTVGMAIDANVLIYERIREELRIGNTPLASITAGFDKALSTITDANITTLIAAVVLFTFGTGPIKGFAVVLSLGILTSLFSALMGTRAQVALVYSGKTKVKSLSI